MTKNTCKLNYKTTKLLTQNTFKVLNYLYKQYIVEHIYHTIAFLTNPNSFVYHFTTFIH